MQFDDEAIPTNTLTCVECGRVAESGARGWKALLDDDDAVVLFCPDCAEREFGG